MTYAQKPNTPPPTPAHMAAIGAFTQKNLKSGVVVMTGGLVRPTRGGRLKCESGKVSVTDGPFAETKELIAGFALVQVSSKEQAVALASEFMQLAGDGTGEVLQVFDQGDLQALRSHVDDHVYETFASAVEQRDKDGLKLDNRLVAIDQAVISEALVEKSVAILTVRFEADIAAVTRNSDGQVVAGSMSDAVQTRDLWTFRRDTSSRDPNWLLIETDEEE
jgi:predicted lipid-binding transport protein (Tim44 family)